MAAFIYSDTIILRRYAATLLHRRFGASNIDLQFLVVAIQTHALCHSYRYYTLVLDKNFGWIYIDENNMDMLDIDSNPWHRAIISAKAPRVIAEIPSIQPSIDRRFFKRINSAALTLCIDLWSVGKRGRIFRASAGLMMKIELPCPNCVRRQLEADGRGRGSHYPMTTGYLRQSSCTLLIFTKKLQLTCISCNINYKESRNW